MDFSKNQELLKDAISGNEAALSSLVTINLGLVRSCALKFMDRGVEYDDLIQIGSIGLIKAIKSFDFERGTALSTYAVPLIIGEIKRYIRDDGLIKVSRIYKRQGAMLMREREKYILENGEEPRIDDLAAICNMSTEDAVIALDASSPVCSISSTIHSQHNDDDSFTLENTLADSNDEIENKITQIAIKQAIAKLPPLWRKIVILRYLNEYSQQKTATILGLTQVKISREEKKILETLRKDLS
jgi:RNA polymerase sporulation-specific sigma factor